MVGILGKTLLLLSLLTSALFGQNSPSSTVQSAFGDRLIYGALRTDDFSLNPFQISSDVQHAVIQLIFGYGLRKSPGKFAQPPSLITTTAASPDYRTWRIVIRRDVVFQNDQSLRNRDIKFTFDALRKFGGNIYNRDLSFANIQNITLNGDLEVIFELKAADRDFPASLADVPIIPADYYADLLNRGYNIFETQPPLGMGPFRIDFTTRDMISLTYNLNYSPGRPFLNSVRVMFFDNQQALVDALVNGKVDYIELPDRNTTDRLLELMHNKLHVFLTPRPTVKVYMLLINVNRTPLDDPTVRRAVHLAVNKENIVERFAKTVGDVAHSLYPSDSPFFARNTFPEKYRPREALQLLRATGWVFNRQSLMMEKSGRPLSFRLHFAENSDLERNIARAVKLNLAEINVNVTPTPVPHILKSELLKRNKYDVLLYAYEYDPAFPFSATETFFYQILGAGQTVPNYQNRYMDRLFGMFRNQPTKHKNIYERLQSYLAREFPVVFLFFDEQVIIGLDRRFAQFRTIERPRDQRMFFLLNPIENWFVPKELQKYP